MDMTPICASVERDLELSADELTAAPAARTPPGVPATSAAKKPAAAPAAG
jgi:hypothetical protein